MAFGLAEEEMNMFGHDDVGVEREAVGAAGSLDDLFEDVLGMGADKNG